MLALVVSQPVSGSGWLTSSLQVWGVQIKEHTQDFARHFAIPGSQGSKLGFLLSHLSEPSGAWVICSGCTVYLAGRKEKRGYTPLSQKSPGHFFFLFCKCRNTHLHVPQIIRFGTGCRTITMELFFLLETRGPGTCKHQPQLCAPNLPAAQEQNWNKLSGLCDSAAGTLSLASSLGCLGSNTRRVASWSRTRLASCGFR